MTYQWTARNNEVINDDESIVIQVWQGGPVGGNEMALRVAEALNAQAAPHPAQHPRWQRRPLRLLAER